MKKKNKKELTDVAYENIISDRQKLEALFEDITRVSRATDDVLSMAAVSEHLVKIADALTKQTAQLVEIAKLQQKSKPTKTETDSEYREDMYSKFDHVSDDEITDAEYEEVRNSEMEN